MSVRKVGEFFQWASAAIPKRLEVFKAAVSSLDPATQDLPEPLVEISATAWQKKRRYFTAVCHHGKVTDLAEFGSWQRALERFLLDRLVPRTFEDFDALDALIKSAEDGGT